MTNREKLLASIFAGLLAGSITLLTTVDAFQASLQTKAKADQYEKTSLVAQKLEAKLPEKRAQLAAARAVKKPSITATPYELGQIVRQLIEKAGGKIKVFSIVGTQEKPVLETSIQAEPAFLPTFFSLLDGTSPGLGLSSMSCNVSSKGILDLTLRVQYEE